VIKHMLAGAPEELLHVDTTRYLSYRSVASSCPAAPFLVPDEVTQGGAGFGMAEAASGFRVPGRLWASARCRSRRRPRDPAVAGNRPWDRTNRWPPPTVPTRTMPQTRALLGRAGAGGHTRRPAGYGPGTLTPGRHRGHVPGCRSSPGMNPAPGRPGRPASPSRSRVPASLPRCPLQAVASCSAMEATRASGLSALMVAMGVPAGRAHHTV
jgi:hypothetical protein